ncbi:MAG: GDP-mannose 4,6-dehydratase [Parcubacteria group bacterium]
MKTIVVTGGAGFIGSNLVDRLISDGFRVVVIDDFSEGKEENLAQHKDNDVTIYRRSITEDLNDIFEKERPEAIMHLAALARVPLSIAKPRETNDVNLNGTLNLLITANDHGVKRFVNYGSSSEYGDPPTRPFKEDMVLQPLSPYGLQKLAADHYARLFHIMHGMETITLRPFNVFGRRMNHEGAYALLIGKVHAWLFNGARFFINGDGEQTRDFTYIDDVIEATMIAMMTDNEKCFGQSFNVGGGRAHIVNEVVDKIIIFSGKSISPEHGPALIEPHDTLADVSKSKELLGWEAKADFDEGLKKTFEYFKELFNK